jgi:polysaccharide export outer membrane protein
MRRGGAAGLVFACLVAMAPCAWAQAQQADGEAPGDVGGGSPYRIGIGDELEIFIYEDDTRERSLVRPDGRISVPLVGDIVAAGLAPEELAGRIREAAGKFYQAPPTVTVAVREINSYRVFLLGEVAEQTMLESIRPLRLLQAIAMAGGTSEFAKGKITVLREVEGGPQERIEIDYDKVIKGREPEGNIWLRSGDLVVVQ